MPARVVNLCFHGLGVPRRELEPGEDRYWITVEVFHRVLDEVAARAGREEIRLSFDDGNLSDAHVGLPALRERGLHATFFALAGRLDEPGSLGAEHLSELVAAGMAIGTHGMDHRPWRGLAPDDRRRELVEARTMLEQASGTAVTEAALPLGRYDRRTLGWLRRAGYAAVYSSDRRAARAGQWLRPRFSLRADDDLGRVRREALDPQPLPGRAVGEAKGLVKRWR